MQENASPWPSIQGCLSTFFCLSLSPLPLSLAYRQLPEQSSLFHTSVPLPRLLHLPRILWPLCLLVLLMASVNSAEGASLSPLLPIPKSAQRDPLGRRALSGSGFTGGPQMQETGTPGAQSLSRHLVGPHGLDVSNVDPQRPHLHTPPWKTSNVVFCVVCRGQCGPRLAPGSPAAVSTGSRLSQPENLSPGGVNKLNPKGGVAGRLHTPCLDISLASSPSRFSHLVSQSPSPLTPRSSCFQTSSSLFSTSSQQHPAAQSVPRAPLQPKILL